MSNVTVLSAGDPFGAPAYDGPADQAWKRLKPGTYQTEQGVGLVVADNRSTTVAFVDLVDFAAGRN